MSDPSTPRRVARVLYLVIGCLALAHFAFVFLLTWHASWLAVLLSLLAAALFIPLTRRPLARLPLLGRPWLRVACFGIAIVFAHSVLDRSDYAEIERKARAFTGATILTGQPHSPPIEGGVLLVDEKGTIVDVGAASSVTIPPEFEVVDVSGRWLMPGLLNAHGHLLLPGMRDPDDPMDIGSLAMPKWVVDAMLGLLDTYVGKRLAVWQMERNTQSALLAGVTTLRSVGDPHYYDVVVRERIKNGRTIGPRLLVSGPILCVTGGHGNQIGLVFDGPEGARRAVRASLARGVDLIKIASTGGVSDSRRIGEAGELQMTPEEIAAVVGEAHRKHVLVASHAESAAGVNEALRAGVDNIEHGAELDDEAIGLFLHNPKALRGYTSYHPTLSVGHALPPMTNAIRDDPIARVMYLNGKEVTERVESGARTAVASGIGLGVGTDAGLVNHSAVWKEMKYLVQYTGISNREALYIGTLGTARSIGVDTTTGSIEGGKSADFIVLDANPIEDLSTLAEPRMVVAQGVVSRP